MRSTTLEQLSAAGAEAILKYLPERISAALSARAAEIEYPIEIVVEMAIANFIDSEALGECRLQTGAR